MLPAPCPASPRTACVHPGNRSRAFPMVWLTQPDCVARPGSQGPVDCTWALTPRGSTLAPCPPHSGKQMGSGPSRVVAELPCQDQPVPLDRPTQRYTQHFGTDPPAPSSPHQWTLVPREEPSTEQQVLAWPMAPKPPSSPSASMMPMQSTVL